MVWVASSGQLLLQLKEGGPSCYFLSILTHPYKQSHPIPTAVIIRIMADKSCRIDVIGVVEKLIDLLILVQLWSIGKCKLISLSMSMTVITVA